MNKMFCLVIVSLLSVNLFASCSAAEPITLLFPTVWFSGRDIGNENIRSLCYEAVKAGFSVVCEPFPSDYGTSPVSGAVSPYKIDKTPNQILDAALKRGPVIIGDAGGWGNYVKYAVDVQPLIAREPSVNRTRLQRLYANKGLITQQSITVVFFNKKQTSNLGLDVPSYKYSWDDFVTFVEKAMNGLDSSQKRLWARFNQGIYMKTLISRTAAVSGANFTTDDNWVTSREFDWVVGIWSRLAAAGVGVANNEVQLKLFSQEIDTINASYIGGEGPLPIWIGRLEQARAWPSSLDWRVLPMPVGPSGSRNIPTIENRHGWRLLSQSKSYEEGWRFLKWMVIGHGAELYSSANPFFLTTPVLEGVMPPISTELVSRGVGRVLESVREAPVAVPIWVSSTLNKGYDSIVAFIKGENTQEDLRAALREAAPQERARLSSLLSSLGNIPTS